MLFQNHAGTVQLLQTDSGLNQTCVYLPLSAVQDLQFPLQFLLSSHSQLPLAFLFFYFLLCVLKLLIHNTHIIRQQTVPLRFPGIIFAKNIIQFRYLLLNSAETVIQLLYICLGFNQLPEIYILLFQNAFPDKLIDSGIGIIRHNSPKLSKIGGQLA